MANNRYSPFASARLRLTLWYMLISYALLAFSTIAAITAESRAFQAVEDTVHSHIRGVVFNIYLQQQIDQFADSFRNRLLVFDVLMFIAATVASYFLSGRTLRPIERMVHEQEQFAADASHELRTPLANIALEIEAHKRSKKQMEPEEGRLLSSIQTEVGRMTSMVAGLLSLVRQNQRTTTAWETVNMSELILEIIGSMRPRFDEKQLRISTEVAPDIEVKGTVDELRQVILILLDNAVKYTPKKEKIIVRLQKQAEWAELVVQNTGVVINSEELPHLFERFYRGKQSHESGSGLGLAIAKSLVENHNGNIAVASQPSFGTSFKVRLPIVQVAAKEVEASVLAVN